MHPWHPRVVSADESPEVGEWPVRLWQRLLIDSHVPFGGRVLVIGCRHPEVIEALDACSFDVDGVDDQPGTIAAASRLFPKFTFTFGQLDESLPVPVHEFDLVLVHDVGLYNRDLLDLPARLATANILACLKPRGQIFFIRRLSGGVDIQAGHDDQCWVRHLACFPGATETTVVADGWFSRATWNWLLGRAPRGSHRVIRHELPLELFTREAWIRCARRGQVTGRAACCASTVAVPVKSPQRRAA